MRTKINKKLYVGKDGQLRLTGSLSFFILKNSTGGDAIYLTLP